MKHALPFLLALAAAGTQAAASLQYRVTPLLPGYDSAACECEMGVGLINDRGQMVGGYTSFLGGRSGVFTLDRTGGEPYYIEGTGGGYGRGAAALNERGEVLVNADRGRRDVVHTYLYRGDGQRAIDISVSEFDYAYGGGLNNQGHAVGADGFPGERVFFYDGTQSRYLDLGLPEGTRVQNVSLNDADTLVGTVSSADWSAFKVEDGRLSLLEGLARAYAINNAGQILGATGTGPNQSVLRDADGRLRLLGFNTSWSLNERGWTVGWTQVGEAQHGFVYRGGRSFDLNSLLGAEDAARWVLSFGLDINNRGQIVGTGLFDGKSMPFLATPVPEPGGCALLLGGLGVVGWSVRRRRGHHHSGGLT